MASPSDSYTAARTAIETMEATVTRLLATLAGFDPQDDEVTGLQSSLADVQTKLIAVQNRLSVRRFFQAFSEDIMKKVEGPPGILVRWSGTRSSIMNLMGPLVGEEEMDAGFRRLMRWAAARKGWILLFWSDDEMEETTRLETI